MLSNPLARQVGLKVGPIVLETLVKHYFERKGDESQSLRQEELLYDEAFTIIKAFLEVASQHTVEEVQGFSNTRTPASFGAHVVRLVIPMSCCNEAATHLIRALGGEDLARQTVGGTKWWQVRGVAGVDAEWITMQKDWNEAKRKQKTRETLKPTTQDPQDEQPDDYEQDMDEMRCILYAHGGGYYFGSVDQERYSIQRHARKIKGRVLAVNYRLAPQYPFPCALQDLIAAYLYLIQPPPDAKHRSVLPSHITVAGDSAGGGLALALLQVIRDSGLPPPAGGFLISPWCDLTHSFPSIHKNTETDVMPPHGLSLQKPSLLWPPPSDELTTRIHASLRNRIRQTLGIDPRPDDPVATTFEDVLSAPPTPGLPVNVGVTTPRMPTTRDNQSLALTTDSGEVISVSQQVHLYTENSLLVHPLVSGALSYLGGLPPLLIIAGDEEVLRDEIIYTAHKAAYPDRYPVNEQARELYPILQGIETRYKSTPVHLQVYDHSAHVLPVLFSFTTPAKYCHRAIAAFCKHVTGLNQSPPKPDGSRSVGANHQPKKRKSLGDLWTKKDSPRRSSSMFVSISQPLPAAAANDSTPPVSTSSKLKRRFSERPIPLSKTTEPNEKVVVPSEPIPCAKTTDSDEQVVSSEPVSITGLSFQPTSPTSFTKLAGDPSIYTRTPLLDASTSVMIRERVSTQGIIRPLGPESELDACQLPHEMVGVFSELVLRRYMTARANFDTKFASTVKKIEKQRRNNLERSKKDTIRNMAVLQHSIAQDDKARSSQGESQEKGILEGLIASSGWSWAWALDSNEQPPPSSIASRRDTAEARRLARIADLREEHAMTGNNLWAIAVNFFSASQNGKSKDDIEVGRKPPKRRSTLSRFLSPKRGDNERRE